MLEVNHLYKSYKSGSITYPVLEDICFTVEKWEFTAIMGQSGSGKTTLLNCISCFIPFDKGTITRGYPSQSTYKQVFIYLIRLGANHAYLKFCIKSQLRKIFFLPAITGSILTLLYTTLIYWQNDRGIDCVEMTTFGINMILMAAAFLYLFLIYKKTFRKFEKEIGISS